MADRIPLPQTDAPVPTPEVPVASDPAIDLRGLPPGEKVRHFPASPGVYLMKDADGKVIYVGKAKVLRNRAGSYFNAQAAIESRTRELVKHIRDIDYILTDTEVDALLLESRLVKDLQPRFNIDLKDDKSYPYLQIRTREEFPRVEFTRNPRRKGTRLYGPFTSARSLRMAIQVLQRVFQFRTCTLDIKSKEDRWRWFRPCLLHSIRQCTAPCNLRVSREDYRKQVKSLVWVMEGKKDRLIRKMEKEMLAASAEMRFEKAGRIRDEIAALKKLEFRGDGSEGVQPHVFKLDPKKGLLGLRKVLGLSKTPRTIECVDIAHLSGQDTVASVVTFLDGVPFKQGYRKYRIQTVEGVDDFASIREVISRRFRNAASDESVFPDILVIDGGKGQLSAALSVFELIGVEPPCLISLAKQEEEIFRPGESESIKLSRSSEGLRILQSARDEAHRFAQHYLHTLRRKRMFDE